MRNTKSNQNRPRANDPISSDPAASYLSREEFLGRGTTVVVTYHPSHGLLCIAEVHEYENGDLGYRPDAPLPSAAIDCLDGSVPILVRGIPEEEIDPIFIHCCGGDFRGALARLARLYCECPEGERGLAALSSYWAEQMHWALLLANARPPSPEIRTGGKE